MSKVIKSYQAGLESEFVLQPLADISEIMKKKALIEQKVNETEECLDDANSDEEDKSSDSEMCIDDYKETAMHILADAGSEAEKIIQEAKAVAMEIEKNANIQAESIKKQAQEKGNATGLEQGLKKGEAESIAKFESLLGEADNVLTEINTEWNKLLKDAEEIIIDIAMSVAEKVILHSVEIDRTIVVSMAEKLLEKARQGERIVMRCNALDMPIIAQKTKDFNRLTGGRPVLVEEDSGISPGGIQIDTDYGSLDGRIENQLSELRLKMAQVIVND